jgi:hypothetical protein
MDKDIQLLWTVHVAHVRVSDFEISRYVHVWIHTCCFSFNVLNRLMVRVEVHPLPKEEETLRWGEITQIKLLNMFGLTIQEAGPVSMLMRVL